MKPGLGIFISLVVSLLVVGGGALIWFLSYTAEFKRHTPPAPPVPLRR